MAAIFQAEIYCDACADRIRAGLTPPADPSNESSWDSDAYPKPCPDDQESDTPTHCASGPQCLSPAMIDGAPAGMLLGRSLTAEGVRYVQEAIEEGGPVAEYWHREFADAGYEFDGPAPISMMLPPNPPRPRPGSIIVEVHGGSVQDITYPTGYTGPGIEVHDYDVDDADGPCHVGHWPAPDPPDAIQASHGPHGEDLPPCVRSMGCYCACHAAGLPPDEPCDTSETRARAIAAGPAEAPDGPYTPGPWHIHHEPTLSTYHIRIEDLDAAPIASLFYSSTGARPQLSREIIEANARLIAAAPALLAALVRLTHYANGRLGANPWGIPEWVEGIEALGRAWGIADKFAVDESPMYRAAIAAGLPPDEPCDTSEARARAIAAGPVQASHGPHGEEWRCCPTVGHETHGQSAIVDQDGRSIAIVYDGDAHGALLASAPAMRRMLEGIIDARDRAALSPDPAYHQIDREIENARAAIAQTKP